MGNQETEAASVRDRLAAMISHAGILAGFGFVIPLLVVLIVSRERSPFAYGHAKQALVFQVIAYAGFYVLSMLGVFLTMVSVSFAIFLNLLSVLRVYVAVVTVMACVATYKAAIGKTFVYPIIGKYLK